MDWECGSLRSLRVVRRYGTALQGTDPPDSSTTSASYSSGGQLELAGAAPMLRQLGTAELSTTSLMKYHEELISRLRMQEAEAAKAAADAADAEATKSEVDE
jgi:hypothetical protein